jgi:ligand-binding SRPBCC domain-containing protein
MNIRLETEVKGHYQTVIAGFDRALFEALLPKQGKVEIAAFTGSKKGDRVHLRFLSPVKAEWISDITEDGANEKEAYFIDQGVQLPFPLQYWKHKHIVQKVTEDTSRIVDDITFRGINPVVSALLYPAIYLGFYPRKRIYRQYFGEV